MLIAAFFGTRDLPGKTSEKAQYKAAYLQISAAPGSRTRGGDCRPLVPSRSARNLILSWWAHRASGRAFIFTKQTARSVERSAGMSFPHPAHRVRVGSATKDGRDGLAAVPSRPSSSSAR